MSRQEQGRGLYNNVPLDDDSRKEFQVLLGKPCVQAVIGEIEREVEEQQAGLAMTDFTTETGLEKAKAQQSKVRGMQRALDILLEGIDMEGVN